MLPNLEDEGTDDVTMKHLVFLVTCFALAGCTGASTTLEYQQTQCEENPWGAGADAEAIARHYGVVVVSAEAFDDGMAYPAVCGAQSSTHVRAEVRGDSAAMTADGWTEA